MARHWPKENLLHSPANLRHSISECDYCYLFALDKRDDRRRHDQFICSANCNPRGFPFVLSSNEMHKQINLWAVNKHMAA